MNAFVRILFGQCFSLNVFGVPEGSAYELFVSGVRVLNRELQAWYLVYHAAHPGTQLTKVTEITKKMLGGTTDSGLLKTKAAETYGLLLFSQFLLQKFGA
eukprot:8863220-Alexandrium_andersonii.AAC.1